MLEKSKITIKGEEYAFLKPYACDLIEIEDQCVTREGFNEFLFNKLVLRLVSSRIDIKELVEFNMCEVELSSGEKILVNDIGYEKYKESFNSLEKKSRTIFCKELLKMSGVTESINLNSFTYDDINNMANAYVNLYDDAELKEVVETISDFCFPEETK